MKKLLPFVQILLIVVFLCLSRTQSFSQIRVTSTTGYAVNIVVTPVAIVPLSSSCQYGYNYNVKLNYAISMTGSNIPASLYTLQGTLGCSSSASHFFDLPNSGGSGSVVSSSRQWTAMQDCNTATVASKNCNTVNIQIEGPGISSRTISFTPVSAIILSIKLVSFTAELENKKVKLNWETANEMNNDYFTIERSTDGTEWKSITKIKGAANSSTSLTYEAYDQSPVSGTSYYRLKQTDFDGQSSYSPVQTIRYEAGLQLLSVYPVPNTGNTLHLAGLSTFKNHELTVLNAGGSTVFATTLAKSSVDLPVLQPGIYIIRVKDRTTGEAANLRYVKI
jgi:hypothetical protein